MYSNQAESRTRSSLKRKMLNLAFETGLIRTGRGLWARSLTVVNYHRIDDPYRKDFDSFKPNVSATPQDFDRQMEYLAKWFHVVSLKDIVAWLDGQKELPPYAALITFDDGYRSFQQYALSVLRELGFTATLFVYTDYVAAGGNAFTWDELKKLQQEGFDIQAHSKSHGDMLRAATEPANEYEKRLEAELVQPRGLFSKISRRAS